MRALLDTHTILWWAEGSARLPTSVVSLIERLDEVFISVASVWEAEVKAAAGRLRLELDLGELAAASGWSELPIRSADATRAARLPAIHADPFDRMLVAQAQASELTVVTCDRQIPRYDVETRVFRPR